MTTAQETTVKSRKEIEISSFVVYKEMWEAQKLNKYLLTIFSLLFSECTIPYVHPKAHIKLSSKRKKSKKTFLLKGKKINLSECNAHEYMEITRVELNEHEIFAMWKTWFYAHFIIQESEKCK